jgi:hypothetical protein
MACLQLAAAVLVAPLAACSLLIDTDVGVRDSGDQDGSIPTGDGGTNSDAGPCGSIARLQDDFSGRELSSVWTQHTQGTAAQDPFTLNERLHLRFDPEPQEGDYTQVESRFAYDLRDHDVTVKAVAQGAAGWTTLEVRAAAAFDRSRKIVGLGRLGDSLVAFVAGDPIQTIRSIPFSDSDHRYWRIRESGGELEFEVADDSQSFTPFTTLTDPGLDLGAVMVGLELFTGDPPIAAIGTSEFDDVNAAATADPACPVADLADDFANGALGPLWMDTSDVGYCTLTTGDGLSASVDSGADCTVDSAHAYSFAGGEQLVVDISQIPDNDDARMSIWLGRDADNYAELVQQAGELTISLTEGGLERSSLTLPNAVGAQWWRVSEQDGDLVVETSMNGSDYSLRHTLSPASLDLAELRVSFTLRSSSLATAVLAGINR